ADFSNGLALGASIDMSDGQDFRNGLDLTSDLDAAGTDRHGIAIDQCGMSKLDGSYHCNPSIHGVIRPVGAMATFLNAPGKVTGTDLLNNQNNCKMMKYAAQCAFSPFDDFTLYCDDGTSDVVLVPDPNRSRPAPPVPSILVRGFLSFGRDWAIARAAGT